MTAIKEAQDKCLAALRHYDQIIIRQTFLPTGRDHRPQLSITNDAGPTGTICDGQTNDTPEASDDDDDGGDDDGEPARSRPHSNPSPKPANCSASKKHSTPQIAVGEFDLAASIGMSVDFLRKDRITKRIIPFFRIGKAIRYNPQRVNEALASLEEGGHKTPKAKKSINTLSAG